MNRYKIITVEELFHIICGMEDDEEISFTADSNLEREPEGWYGIKVINAFGGFYYIIGYYNGGAATLLDAEDEYLSAGDLKHALEEVVRDFDGIHICIDTGEED